ncbi:SDR family oxidoreductase [Mycobacterium sp. GA-2829]|uniref:SDR family NAD(P)-dependent oxidoreductase n=1 Tax=Mycobacterium sp. GA-2829 TaxID=1772283 RepID=UPI00073FF43E|nr:SDR family NAD(P)-dependent oxidoreductase [Mycobacterium sp. GA-2829]KUI22352.1 short-chain dehydrogenase [Mycobacterium sp. GA-2829]
MRLEGRRVLVTGATGGIGNAIACRLATRGCRMVLTGRRREGLTELVDALGPPARGVVADLTESDDVLALLEDAGQIDVLVTSAGVGPVEGLAEISRDALEEAVRINLLAPAELARAVVPAMRRRGSGHIVFVCSVAGFVATSANSPVYTATKWGLRGLGLALRQELHRDGIGVSTVFPGPIRDVGMSVQLGVPLPRRIATNSADEVAAAVERAVERNRAETTVAGSGVRLAGLIGRLAPVLVGDAARVAGAERFRRTVLDVREHGGVATTNR